MLNKPLLIWTIELCYTKTASKYHAQSPRADFNPSSVGEQARRVLGINFRFCCILASQNINKYDNIPGTNVVAMFLFLNHLTSVVIHWNFAFSGLEGCGGKFWFVWFHGGG
jgi:hypothetical protein